MAYRLPESKTFATLAVVLLTASACGGDGEASVDSVPPPSTTATTIAPATTTIATTSTTTTEPPELSGTPAFDSTSSVSTVGIDVVTFGMTVDRAEQVLGTMLVNVVERTDTSCFQVRPIGGPLGVELTVTAGTIERVDVSNDIVTTRSGAGVGKTEDELLALFGDRLSTVPRDGGGNSIIFTPTDPGDADFRVIFETDGTTVTHFRSGRVPIIDPEVACEVN